MTNEKADVVRAKVAVQLFQSNTTLNRVLSGSMQPGDDTGIFVQGMGRGELLRVGTWSRKKAERYVASMLRVSVAVPHLLYRGTGLPWLVDMHTGSSKASGGLAVQTLTVPDILYMIRYGAPCKLTHPISCTTDVRIAEEFARRASKKSGGFVHVIEGCERTLRAVDVNAILGSDSMASREVEFIVLPGLRDQASVFMHPTRIKGNKVWWTTSNASVAVAHPPRPRIVI